MKGNVLTNRDKNRRALDYYPTPPDVTHALMKFIKLPLSVVWEPACGEGKMADVISQYGHLVLSTDIEHMGYGDGGIDFLTANIHCNAIITNPPFHLSEQFIIHAVSQAPFVAMLLKSQYWHAARRSKLFMDTPPAYVLPLTWRPDFLAGERGGAPTMEVLWTVWMKGQTDTRYRLLTRPKLEKS